MPRFTEPTDGAPAGRGLAHLDTGQVTCWTSGTSWHRWSLMSMLAHPLLAAGALRERQRNRAELADELAMVPVSPRELLALLRVFTLPLPLPLPLPHQDTAPAHVLRWSHWRRRHQQRAADCHRRWDNVTAVAIT